MVWLASKSMFSPVQVRFSSGRGQIMRKYMWLAGLTLGLAWASSAHAQAPPSSSSIPSVITNLLKFPKAINVNVQPNITNNSPMDYRMVTMPIGGSYSRPNTTGTAFPYRLTSMFYQPSRTNFISSSTTFGKSTFPTPIQMQAAAPYYFMPFQMYRAAPIQP